MEKILIYLLLLITYGYFIHTQSPSELSPNNAPTSGNASIIITGADLSNITFCNFSTIQVLAIYDNITDTIMCTAPPSPMGTVVVTLINNLGANYTVPGTFIYQDISASFIVFPNNGAQAGGDFIQVNGSGFLNTSYLTCLFASKDSKANFISNSTIICITPNGTQNESDLLYVSNNGVNFISTGVTFVYLDITGPFTTSPKSSFVSLSTISIYGNGFYNSSSLVCMIGSIISPAKFINSSFVQCTVPQVTGNQSVSISNNGFEFQLIGYFIFNAVSSSKPNSSIHSSHQKPMIAITATIGFLVGVPIGAVIILTIIIAVPCLCIRAKRNKKKVIKPLPADPDDKIYKSSNF